VAETCSRSFDESLLSGYLDDALTQGDAQRVRIHLEDCSSCHTLVVDMKRIRKATMTTPFTSPADEQWDERPQGTGSRSAFTLGWLVLIIWGVGVIGFALGHAWAGPQTWIERLILFGGGSGIALVFLSVLIDRLKNRKTDRYREVEK